MTVGSSEFPVGKALSLLVVASLLFLPVMKCGPVEFVGHEILRNEPPDTGDLTEGLGRVGRAMGGSDTANTDRTSAGGTMRSTLFPPAKTWMWILYVAIFAAAVISFFAASGSRARALLGALGAAALLAFLGHFEKAVMAGDESHVPAGISLLEWASGAYVAMIGFALILYDGLRTPGSRYRPSARNGDP